MNAEVLIPPDSHKCQAEITEGNAFTLGGTRRTRQCGNKPEVIAFEREPGADGLKGSMSLCGSCKTEFIKQYGLNFADFVPIE